MNLTAPSVKEAAGTAPSQQLNPVAGKDNLTVVIPDYGVQPGDQVSVTWTGTAGDGSYTTPVQVLPPNREITMPVSVIAYNLGRPVTVTYTVTRGSESPPSASLNLAVQALTQDDLLVAKPRILQAANNGEGPELDVATLTGDATVRIDSWPLIAQGQYVWLRVKGKNNDDTDYERVLWSSALDSRVSAGWVSSGFATNTVPLNDLRGLRNGSALTVEFKATLNQSVEEGQADTFPLRIYAVRTVERLTIDTSVMCLDGVSIKINWPRTGLDSDNNTDIRRASGGKLPYRFSSRNSDIASIRSDDTVVGEANGSVYIDVSDANGDTVSFPVVVSNVYRLVVNDGPFVSGTEAMRWVDSVSSQTRMTWPAFKDVQKVYSKPYPYPYRAVHYWLYPHVSDPLYAYFDYVTQTALFSNPDNRQVSGCMALMRT
ncbi:hypothetical protein HU811_26685 [Pseudomonas sp. SWRI196]|uniref:Uncharacterized protein n=1 Tax=Pseudomonas tehranensis TaxID=2745502 RepID=A0ABR6V053_9PSED|nr:hypothetical protein [Pseudomonas tehranensis]